MIKKYLIVNKEILPDYFDKVIEARNLIQSGEVKGGISEAVKKVGISRSTYYKYKDYVFLPSDSFGKMATLSFFLKHKKGILSCVLNQISDINGNILTIHQDIPINGSANVSITLDVSEIFGTIDDMLQTLQQIEGVSSVKLLAIE